MNESWFVRRARGWNTRATLIVKMAIVSGVGAAAASAAAKAPAAAAGLPNFLIIVCDDQRPDSLEFMDSVQKKLVKTGVLFTHNFATTSLCCPSRSTVFTGLYASNHGVWGNKQKLTHPNLFQALDGAGYFTGLVGKGICGWFNRPQPGFDYWVAGQGYIDPRLNVQGTQQTIPGYSTDILGDFGVDFLNQAATKNEPFILYFSPYSPHSPFTPAEPDLALFSDRSFDPSPNLNEADQTDKPHWLQAFPELTHKQLNDAAEVWRNQLRCLQSVDRAVDRLLETLDQHDLMDNTVIFYTSDNGLVLGEHRLYKTKHLAYESSSRVPLVIRYPYAPSRGRTESRVVANIDIAPTIFQLAGVTPAWSLDGESLVPLLEGTNVWRDEVLLEGWPETPFQALRTSLYKYVEYQWDQPELYDLGMDPFELENQARNPAYADVVEALRSRLHQLVFNRIEDTSPLVELGSWRAVADPLASNGGMMASSTPGATAAYAPRYPCTEMRLKLYRGPDQGYAEVLVDGILVETLDLYSPVPDHSFEWTSGPLVLGKHSLSVRCVGSANFLSTNSEVRVDSLWSMEFKPSGVNLNRRIEDNHPRVAYDGWRGRREDLAFGGTYRHLSGPGSATINFSGDTAVLLMANGPNLGACTVNVGSYTTTINLWAPINSFRVPYVFAGLGPGTHRITVSTDGLSGGIALDAASNEMPFQSSKAPTEVPSSCCVSPLSRADLHD